MSPFKFSAFILIFSLLILPRANAAESANFLSHIGGTLGGDYDIGTLKNSDLGLNARTMDALSLEGMVGYRFGRFLVGPDFDYRWEDQIGNGNGSLKGHGWLFGLGGVYDLCPQMSIQAAIDFVGHYYLSTGDDARLSEPVIVRAKAQYYPIKKIPQLSFDLDLQYVNYSNLRVSGADFSRATNGFLVGVGATWHFGERFFAHHEMMSEPVSQSAVTKEVVTAPAHAVTEHQVQEFKQDLEKIVDVKKTANGLLVNIKGDASFKTGSAELTGQSRENIEKTAKILSQKSDTKILVQGHCDSSGDKAYNLKLSKARAESVRKVLISGGLRAENISVEGKGESTPIATNKTEAGRAANRRVEIYIE